MSDNYSREETGAFGGGYRSNADSGTYDKQVEQTLSESQVNREYFNLKFEAFEKRIDEIKENINTRISDLKTDLTGKIDDVKDRFTVVWVVIGILASVLAAAIFLIPYFMNEDDRKAIESINTIIKDINEKDIEENLYLQ